MEELNELEKKADGWLAHSTKPGIQGHLQFGHTMPLVVWTDINRTNPLFYDDLGDASAWTGQVRTYL